jgi:hypothetical protein
MDARRAAADAREQMIRDGQEMWRGEDARRRITTTIDPIGRKTIVIQSEEGDDDQDQAEPRTSNKQARGSSEEKDEPRKGSGDQINIHAASSADGQRMADQARLRDGAQRIRDQEEHLRALWRDGRAAASAEEARKAWVADSASEWSARKPADKPIVQDARPTSLEDARRLRDEARDEMIARGARAWKGRNNG